MSMFLLGATAAVFATVALFFLRFWTQTRDRLFVFFAAAFALLALHPVLIATVRPGDETRHWFFVVRLVAFVLILLAVIDKNRPGHGRE